MKRVVVLAAAVAFAATGASAETMSPWTGFHVGGHVSAGWGQAYWDTPDGIAVWAPTIGFPAVGLTTGVAGGVQFGYGHDFGPLFAGIEATFSFTNIDGQVQCGDGSVSGYICNTALPSYGTLTGRIGHAFGNTLIYADAGLAWGRHELEITESYYAYVFDLPEAHSWGSASERSIGWTVGFGLERYLSHGFSVRADYSYVRFPEREVTLTSPFWPDTDAIVAEGYHIATLGLNYRFGQDGYQSEQASAPAWDVAFGTRTWLNAPSYRFDLYDPFSPGSQISRLIYSGSLGLAGEGFVNATSPGGLFVNARLGAGASWGGTLIDEDFPPYIDPYTATSSDLQGNRLSYAGVDIGWKAERPRGAFGIFAGLTGMLERYQAFGCQQTAPPSLICVPPVPDDYEVITQTSLWAGLRVGVMAEYALTDRLDWHGEAAFLPLVAFAGVDNHWLRPDINPLPMVGLGQGVQFETGITLAVTPRLDVGIGGRLWLLRASGEAYFPGIAQPIDAVSLTYGAFFELTYHLGG